ncbi:metallophosphoesterase family protein [Candidatus Uabimicrobium amorphum]|uniref:Phosphoesterase n=1 Tax=Uabimicrobium amorphum TaxID=2596890 RepID=A0A5S9ITI5_UABAM|nr:metallophosphoesterase family protein [Candidatus Uabimicrobium amorphum]BBM87346.1 phosphoesterase [Candidatus Uabimicrobium amorphum]
MIAIIASIHGNLQALQAVIEDIDKRNIKTIYCLGDMVGYGPNPRECIEIVRDRCEFCLRGDFEENIMRQSLSSTPGVLEITIEWIRNQLYSESYPETQNNELWDVIANAKQKVYRDRCLYAHNASPNNGYAVPLSFIQLKYTMSHFSNYNVFFCGGSHVPGVFTEEYQYHYAADINNLFYLSPTSKQIIDVGSVGKPQDRNNHACYAILNDQTLQWIRVEYDINKTIEEIENCTLPNTIADYLRREI